VDCRRSAGFSGVKALAPIGCNKGGLKADNSLSLAWGLRPGQKTRPEAAIRRLAMQGDPESRTANVKLAGVRKSEAPAKAQR
jgi:hypothetical protein